MLQKGESMNMGISRKNILIAIDGPNGSGKTTVIHEIRNMLEAEDNSKIFITKEPTNTKLGIFCKSISSDVCGKALANLVAADRFEHNKTIERNITIYDFVISDRYLFSSYIFQCVDGVEKEYIWEINKGVRHPNLQIVISGDVELLRERLRDRENLDRFEKDKTADEVKYTKEAIEFFRKMYPEITLHEVTSSNEKENEVYKNSIEVYNYIKGFLENV